MNIQYNVLSATHVLDVETQKYVAGRTQLDGQRNENLSVKEVKHFN